MLGFVCSHVGVRSSIIVVLLLYFCEVFFLLYFVCCTVDYFILPVRQADVAFLTLFIGISGGKHGLLVLVPITTVV